MLVWETININRYWENTQIPFLRKPLQNQKCCISSMKKSKLQQKEKQKVKGKKKYSRDNQDLYMKTYVILDINGWMID